MTAPTFGIFRVPGDGTGSFDQHHHDVAETWIVLKGRGRVEVNGRAFDVEPGDIIITPAWQTHDVLAVYGGMPLVVSWFDGGDHRHGREGDGRHKVAKVPFSRLLP